MMQDGLVSGLTATVSILILFLSAGCASSYQTYAVLEPVKESDPDLTCRLLDEEIAEANDLRDEILDEHGDVIADAVTGTAVQAVTNPINAILSGVMRSVSVSSTTKQYTEAAAAAGSRMEQLLKYKRDKDCPSGMTADRDYTDEDIVVALEELLAHYEAGEIDAKEYVKQRSRLLDKVRY